MASVWFCFEGPEPTRGGPAYRTPVIHCIEELGLSESQLLSGVLPPRPKFNERSKLGAFAGYKHVVVELDRGEAATVGWRPGYYLLTLTPREVTERLGPPTSPVPVDG